MWTANKLSQHAHVSGEVHSGDDVSEVGKQAVEHGDVLYGSVIEVLNVDALTALSCPERHVGLGKQHVAVGAEAYGQRAASQGGKLHSSGCWGADCDQAQEEASHTSALTMVELSTQSRLLVAYRSATRIAAVSTKQTRMTAPWVEVRSQAALTPHPGQNASAARCSAVCTAMRSVSTVRYCDAELTASVRP